MANLMVPHQVTIDELVESYIAHAIKNAANVIASLQQLGKAVYVLSAGLYPAVSGFAKRLGVLEQNIHAVPLYFDEQYQYCDFDHHSPLVNNNGKCQIVQEIKQMHKRVLLMGDGMNDVATKHLLERFVGYGGAFERPRMAVEEDFYIAVNDLTALLPLCLTAIEMQEFMQQHPHLYHQAEQHLQRKQIIINLKKESV